MASFAAPSVAMRFFGMNLLRTFLDKIINIGVQEDRREEWYVVSSVVYGEVLEWNTPHWRVAIHILSNQIEFSGEEQQEMLNAMVAGGSLKKETILRLKAVITDLIRANGLIDTGNYIGSIAVGPSREEAFAQSDIQLLDPTTSVFAI